MSRKKKKGAPKKAKAPVAEPAFSIGSRVRVKPGTPDADYPDMPLGGWAGWVVEVDTEKNQHLYCVEWNAYTLQHMHPVFHTRCERDGLDDAASWMGEEDLEPDSGGPAQMEQPQELRARPLDPTLPDDRVRAVFKLTTDDPLPPVDDANLRRYFEHLALNLKLPLTADYTDLDLGLPLARDPYKIIELISPRAGDAEDGLFCIALREDERVEFPLSQMEPRLDSRSRQLLSDYAFWFWMYGGEQGRSAPERPLSPEEAAAQGWRTIINALSRCGLYGAAAGAAVGAVTATMDHVWFAMTVGAVTAGVIGYVAGTRFGFFFGKVRRINSGPIVGGIFGLIGGAVAGAIAGPLVVAYGGTILGSILGAILGQGLRLLSRRLPGPVMGGLVGAVAGAIVWAWMVNADQTMIGLLYGIPAGAAGAVLLVIGFFGGLLLIDVNAEEP